MDDPWMAGTAAAILAVIGVTHSVLGERKLLGPLLADRRWSTSLPRGAADRVFRFAWHLTSLAWWGLAAGALGVDAVVVLGAVALVSGVVILAMLPGHLAWPLFLLAAMYAGIAGGVIGSGVLRSVASIAAVIAAAAALLHVAWAVGWARTWAAMAVPVTREGDAVLRPSAAATALVAGALGIFAAAVMVTARTSASGGRWVVGAAVGLLVLRAIGDGRWVGFSKRERLTPFARRDDAVFTPVVVTLALGGLAALAV